MKIIRNLLIGFLLLCIAIIVFSPNGEPLEPTDKTEQTKQVTTKPKPKPKPVPKTTTSKTKPKGSSGVYVPKRAASLASSENCYNQMMDARAAGDRDAFQALINVGCVMVYDPSKRKLELVLHKVGGIGQPNVYFIKGKSQYKIWALPSQLTEK